MNFFFSQRLEFIPSSRMIINQATISGSDS